MERMVEMAQSEAVGCMFDEGQDGINGNPG